MNVRKRIATVGAAATLGLLVAGGVASAAENAQVGHNDGSDPTVGVTWNKSARFAQGYANEPGAQTEIPVWLQYQDQPGLLHNIWTGLSGHHDDFVIRNERMGFGNVTDNNATQGPFRACANFGGTDLGGGSHPHTVCTPWVNGMP